MGSASPSVKFRILGPLECACDERPLELGGPQQHTLLALLLVNANRAISSDQLIDALWGAEPAPGSPKRLQVAIARLRKALELGEAARLQTVGGGYRLRIERNELDADAFAERVTHGRRSLHANEPLLASELLGAALKLWRGPALADVAYEPFAQSEIRRLEELRTTALAARIDADLQLGRHPDLVGELDVLVTRHPTHERFPRQLMLALYRCGRQADALDVFQHTRTRLAELLGLEPGPALRSMQAQVLAQDEALELPVERRGAPRFSRAGPASVTRLRPRREERAFLIVNPGDEQQRIVAIDPDRQLTVGRTSGADVALPSDQKVSRLHALLECIDGTWVLSDEGLSSNGTYCNGMRVHGPRVLNDGDMVRVGETLIEFRDPCRAREDGTVVSTSTGTRLSA